MFYKLEANGTSVYKSTLLDEVCHGFSTRIGGVSTGVTASLNMGYDRGEDADTVNENRRIFARACGINDECFAGENVFVSAKQIHSGRIEYVVGANAASDFVCDGFVTDMAGVPIAIKTADCVPILLYEGGAGVAAAVHAGWRGTAHGIAAAAVERMCRLGAKRDRIRAAIGPSIEYDCYEVSDDFEEQFRAVAAASPYIKMRIGAEGMTKDFITRGDDGKMRCDLPAVNERLLALAGVLPKNIDVSGICTMCHPEEFYSHRRCGGARGVMASVIML